MLDGSPSAASRLRAGRSATTTSGRDVVVTFSTETWDDAVRRGFCRPPEQLALSLRADEAVRHLLVANPFRSRAAQLAELTVRRPEPFPSDELTHLFRPRRLRRGLPMSEPEARDMVTRYDAALGAATRRYRMVDPVVVTANVLVAGLADLRWAGGVVFYARDDWSVKATTPSVRGAFEAAYDGIRRRGRAVAAVSEVLLDRIAPTGPALVVPNGVDPAVWGPRRPMPEPVAEPARPVIAYAGTLNDRLDSAAVAEIAAAFPHGTVALYGPRGHADPVPDLLRLPNVHYGGVLQPVELAAVLQHVDVCVMPHHRTPLTEAMCPLKLTEYLAAGRPVVATDLPATRSDTTGRVLLVEPGGDWGAAVTAALALPPVDEDERLAYVAASSWRMRHRPLLDLVLG